MRWRIATTLVAMLSLPLWAQGRFAGGGTASGWSRPPAARAPSPGMTISVAQPHPSEWPHHIGAGAVFLGNPWLTAYEPINPPATNPPVIVLAAPPPAGPSSTEPEKSVEPLLIELRGDRYVRVVGASPANSPQSAGWISREETSGDRKLDRPELPPTVLIFRDGHRELLNEYSIIDATLYTAGDYWQSGSWTRKIPLTTVDLSATVAANRDAGVRFVLPSGPNVVVTRP
jgi:hypothetical protein